MVLFPPGESSSLSPRVCGVSDQLLCSVLPVHAGPAEATGQVSQETALTSLRVIDLLTPPTSMLGRSYKVPSQL